MRKIYLQKRIKENNAFWDVNWSHCSLEEIIKDVDNNFMNPIFLKYFPTQGKILEAGCGLGKFVIYYKNKGYDIEGVDFARETISRIKMYDPNLPVKVEDLINLSCEDGYYSIYYSGGVIEHFEDGASAILKEAYRVLNKYGLLIITVPYINLMRRLEDFIWFRLLRNKSNTKRKMDNTPYYFTLTKNHSDDLNRSEGWLFYEYVYKKDEIINLLKESGFVPIFFKRVQIKWGIKTIYYINNLIKDYVKPEDKQRKIFILNLVKNYLLNESKDTVTCNILTHILGLFFAHQIAIVCRKVE